MSKSHDRTIARSHDRTIDVEVVVDDDVAEADHAAPHVGLSCRQPPSRQQAVCDVAVPLDVAGPEPRDEVGTEIIEDLDGDL
jgi:hypothetical protein